LAEIARKETARLEHASGRLPPAVREALACLSFANICLLRVWKEILTFSKTDAYFMKSLPNPADYAAAILNAALLAAVMFAVLRFGRRSLPPRLWRTVRFALLFVVLIPLNSVRAVLSADYPSLKAPMVVLFTPLNAALALAVAAAAIWFTWRRQDQVFGLIASALVLASPLCALTFGEAIWAAATLDGGAYRDGRTAARLPADRTARRVLWVVFDEWDYRLTFVDRPAGLSLPAVDRFRSESLSATDVHTPALDTGTVLPALITGRDLRRSGSPAAQAPVDWTTLPTVFSAARHAGFNTALIGWFLPYCRILNDSLNECQWWPLPVQANSTGDTLGEKIPGQLASLFQTNTLAPFGQSAATRHAVRIYHEYLERSRSAATDPDLGLVFLHAPFPHAPHFYNRVSRQFDGRNHPIRGYIDSLALVDRTLAEWRAEMERDGTWERTAVLLTADHPFREARLLDGRFDERVPFLLKLPGATRAASYDARLDAVVTPSLVLAILRREVSDVAGAIAWLRRHPDGRTAPPL
jgi:sulfatase-like protein